MRRLLNRRTGTGAAALAAATVLAGLAIAGTTGGHSAKEVKLASGAAWLASSRVGQLTLLDGSTAEVSAQVLVAQQGVSIDVVQQGATAYAVDRVAGTIRRVDGATFETGQPAVPIPDAGSGIAAFAGTESLYAVDTRRGLLAETDPRSLSTRGEPRSMAARVSSGGVTMDEHNRLWIIDTVSGDLTRISPGGDRVTRHLLDKPEKALLTMADDVPVVVDPVQRKATSIDAETGHPNGAVELDLRDDDAVQISGSHRSKRIYVVTSRGVLNICDLGVRLCDRAIPLGEANTSFGAAVEAGNRLFVPDYTGGRVWIVDLLNRTVVARPEVLPPGRFQLLTRDGVVFFNDPNSEKAGVVLLDGGIRNAAKYDPGDPSKGLISPGENGAPSTSDPSQPPPASEPSPNQPPNPPPAPGPTSTPPPPEPPPQQPRVEPPPTSTPPPQPPPPNTPPELRIALSKANPEVNEDIRLEVRTTTGAVPASAHWEFGDGTNADAVTTQHRWATAGTFQVSVQARMPDGQQATTAVSLQVTALGSLRANSSAGGRITGSGLNCPPTCAAQVSVGQRVTLTAAPDPGFQFSAWDSGCETTSGLTCTFTMTDDKLIVASFNQSRVTFTASVPGGNGTVAVNGVSCPPTCTTTHQPGSNVALVATPAAGFEFVRWTNGCATPTAATCTVQATANRNLSASFRRPQVTLTVVLNIGLGAPPLTATGGLVTGGGMSCAPTCSIQVDQGSIVTLTGNNGPDNYRLAFWSDVCMDGRFQVTCRMQMDTNKSVTANYRQFS
jgi:hypothetical protein